MKAARPNTLQNPFQNRFHDPVTWRLDEMQAHSNVIWPRQRSHGPHEAESDGCSILLAEDYVERSDARADVGKFTGVLALFIVLLASAVLFRMV
jgi:hypothetical protein